MQNLNVTPALSATIINLLKSSGNPPRDALARVRYIIHFLARSNYLLLLQRDKSSHPVSKLLVGLAEQSAEQESNHFQMTTLLLPKEIFDSLEERFRGRVH